MASATIGTTLSELMRAAIRRTRTWTAEDSVAVRERTRQVDRFRIRQIVRGARGGFDLSR